MQHISNKDAKSLFFIFFHPIHEGKKELYPLLLLLKFVPIRFSISARKLRAIRRCINPNNLGIELYDFVNLILLPTFVRERLTTDTLEFSVNLGFYLQVVRLHGRN